MQEKHNKGLFLMVRFHRKLYHSAFIGKTVCFSCISVLPKTFDCSSHHLQSTHCLSPWVAEAKRKENVSAQSQLISASRNTHESRLSHPQIPCTKPLLFLHCPCLAVWIPWVPPAPTPSGEDFGVTMACPYPNPTWPLPRAPLCRTATRFPQNQGRSRRKPQPHLLTFAQHFSLPPPLPLGWDAMGCLDTHC